MTVFSLEDEPSSRTLASLHLHTAPVSSVASSSSGNHLLTASWDGLVGLWDTTVPATDEVPDTQPGLGSDASRKKRRKVESSDRPVRKAPLSVLKSHTARVSRALFEHAATPKVAYSCGLDATIRKWDIENGICTDTIVSQTIMFNTVLSHKSRGSVFSLDCFSETVSRSCTHPVWAHSPGSFDGPHRIRVRSPCSK